MENNKQIYLVDDLPNMHICKDKASSKNPEVLILHLSDNGECLLTWHGKESYEIKRYEIAADRPELKSEYKLKYEAAKGYLGTKRTEDADFSPDSYDSKSPSYTNYRVMFETKGMFAVTKEQAKILTEEAYTENFGKTLSEIVKSKNMLNIELAPERKKERKKILDKDYKDALSALREHNKSLDKETPKNTPPFLKLVSKFKSLSR